MAFSLTTYFRKEVLCMINNITAKNTTVTEAIRAYVEKKFAKFDKYAPDETVVHTKIEVKDNGNRHKVEVTIVLGKQTLRAEATDADMYAAIDNVEKTMCRLLKKRKEKIVDRRQQGGELIVATDTTVPEYEITRTKNHNILSMTVQEACEAMEMVGHPFYVYHDADNNKTCAVYVRDDGTYGQLFYD